METVEMEAVNWTFVPSEAFFDLVRQAVEAAIRTRDRQKMNLLHVC